MKTLKEKGIDSIIVFIISFLYLELIFRIIMKYNIFSLDLINIALFVIFYAIIAKFLCSFLKDKYNKIIFYILLFITCFYFGVQLVVYQIFGFCFDFSLLNTTDQITEFASDGFKLILNNIVYVVLVFIPFIISLIFHKYINTKKNKLEENIVLLLIGCIFYLLFFGSIKVTKNEEYSAHKLYFVNHNIELALKKLGVINSCFLDLERIIFNVEEKVVYVNIDNEVEEVEDKKEEEVKYDYNRLSIDFDSLKENSSGTVKEMHEYFSNESGTLQNEYTGMFNNKNLILFMAESFNEIAVSKELTPTLYKLVNSGFVFDDFYTPTISSTIGGEFQELTGLVAAPGFISPWKNGVNTYPYGIANMFKNIDYNTYAYHNHSYAFQNRYKYLKTLGFDNFTACFNGLEKKINCKIWPESDVELIDATFLDYANSDKPFMVYYATVSGHGEYTWNNYISKKNKELVNNLEYSDSVKAYLAAQIELDKALELLINKLEENNLLDDTVIALVGDHYPYFLSVNEVNELSSVEKEGVISINHSNFILWNNTMDTIHVKKVGSQIDVLPTIYNLFGIDYDSRIIIGKDILSTEPGLAIFGNRSWVSDYGKYYSASNEFILNDGMKVTDDYVSKMNQIVSNKINMSKLIMTQDYYKYFK